MMIKIVKYSVFIIILASLLFLAWYMGFKNSFLEKKTEINKEIVLQQVKNVLKLGTIEGYFSEVYDYKEHIGFDFSPFRKKALIRVKAKVLVGFDMDSINIEVIQKDKEVIISNIPQSTILSIDHDLDYYDITEGTFNSFTTSDYNKMNNQSKLYIKNTALKSNLLEKSQIQLDEHLNLLKSLLNSYGWELIIVPENKNVEYKG